MRSAPALVPLLAALALFAAPRVVHSQSAERGSAIVATLRQKYPKVQPVAVGVETDTPRIALFVPQTEWAGLSGEDQASLALYVKSLIPAARANPEPYLALPQKGPPSPLSRARFANLCAECWFIGVGRLTLDGKGVLFDKVVVEGGAGQTQEKPLPSSAGREREKPKQSPLVGKGAESAKGGRQGAVAERAPHRHDTQQNVGVGTPRREDKGVQEVSSGVMDLPLLLLGLAGMLLLVLAVRVRSLLLSLACSLLGGAALARVLVRWLMP